MSVQLDFPIALRLEGKTVLLIGGGRIAESRLDSLLAAGARVRVVAIEVTEAIAAHAARTEIILDRRPYRPGDCRGAALVLSAIDDPSVSRAIAAESAAFGILYNAADLPELCDFHVPSVGRRGPLTIAVSSAGLAPAISALARRRAMAVIGPEFAAAAKLFGLLRARLPKGAERTRRLRALAARFAGGLP